MATFVIDQKKLTVTIHRENCIELQQKKLRDCGCGEPDLPEDQCIICEEHFQITDINRLMNQRYWMLLLCDVCFDDYMVSPRS